MHSERAARWARLTDAAKELASAFEKRRHDRYDGENPVPENLAELRRAGLTSVNVPTVYGGFRATLEENIELLRILAGGCGATAFAVSEAIAEDRPHAEAPQWGNYCDAAVLLGLAERAYRLAIEYTKDSSNGIADGPVRQPGPQFAVARMRASVATMTGLLTRFAGERARGEEESTVLADSFTARYYLAVETEQVVSAAMELARVAGAGAVRRIGQIWQDVKVGPAAPWSTDLARELIGKAALGIDPTETPRWL